MKLFEIIQTKKTEVPHEGDFKTADLHFAKKLSQRGAEELKDPDTHSSGTFAKGSADNDPHMYNKDYYLPAKKETDPFLLYAEAIEPYMGVNPYFPIIYNIENIKDAKGEKIPKFKMEKLQGPNSFSEESMLAMGNKMFGEAFEEVCGHVRANTSYAIFGRICYYISNAANTNSYAKIKDKNLIQALEILQKIKATDKEILFDIGIDNVMIRGTSKGPQTVINDPLFHNVDIWRVR